MNRVVLAERATLGALLLEPDQVRTVSGWLRESDFLHPRSRITYRLITASAARPGPVGAVRVLDAARADGQARLNDVAGPYLHELLASPGGPGRSAVYARLVLHASVRRTLTEGALDLARAASATGRRPDRVPALVDAVGAMLAQVGRLQDRLEEADPGYARQPGRTAGPRDSRQRPLPGRRELESDLVAALRDNPGLILAIGGWLTTQDFASRAHASTFRSMLSLARSGGPVDHVTTLWNRRDRLAGAPVVAAHVVATQSRCTSHETIRLARDLLATSISARTRTAAEAIAALDRDPAPSTARRLRTATQALDRCLDHARRWVDSCPRRPGDPPPPAPGPSRLADAASCGDRARPGT